MQSRVVWAKEEDCSEILKFIQELAFYEKLSHEVVATEESIRQTLFGPHKKAEVILLEENDIRVGFAIFFHNYSTFLSKSGLYLEDLYVKETHRGKGYGKKLLSFLAQIALERNCARFEWAVLNWNTPAIEFYKALGAESMNGWTVNRLTGKALENLAQK